MDIKTVEKGKMDALKALADANIAVSGVKATLATLKEEESEYLLEREQKALKEVQKIINDSETVLKTALENYTVIHQFGKDASELAVFVLEAYGDFKVLQSSFKELTEEWERSVVATKTSLEEMKKAILLDKGQLKLDQKAVETGWKAIAESKRKIKDDRETIERAIIRLKEGKI